MSKREIQPREGTAESNVACPACGVGLVLSVANVVDGVLPIPDGFQNLTEMTAVWATRERGVTVHDLRPYTLNPQPINAIKRTGERLGGLVMGRAKYREGTVYVMAGSEEAAAERASMASYLRNREIERRDGLPSTTLGQHRAQAQAG
jgi:hypothetical protein